MKKPNLKFSAYDKAEKLFEFEAPSYETALVKAKKINSGISHINGIKMAPDKPKL